MSHLHSFLHKKIISSIQENKFNNTSNNVKSEIGEVFSEDMYNQINEQIEKLDKNSDRYSQGYSGKVYRVKLTLGGKPNTFLIIKERTGGINKISHEYENHTDFLKFDNKQQSPYITIPYVYGLHNTPSGEKYLVMKFINGLTLYTYKLSKSLPIVYDELIAVAPYLKNSLPQSTKIMNITNDKEAKAMFELLITQFKNHGEKSDFFQKYLITFFNRHGTFEEQGIAMEQQQAMLFDKLIAQYSFLGEIDESIITTLQDACSQYFKNAHEQGLYHNDITHRNVILGTDGKIYIIDFDKSGSTPLGNNILKAGHKTKTYKGVPIIGDYRLVNYLESLKKKS